MFNKNCQKAVGFTETFNEVTQTTHGITWCCLDVYGDFVFARSHQ